LLLLHLRGLAVREALDVSLLVLADGECALGVSSNEQRNIEGYAEGKAAKAREEDQ
jgi:hypothetical protein